MCAGTGTIVISIGGNVVPYMMDDLDTVEPCEDCGGSGIESECGECMDQREEDYNA